MKRLLALLLFSIPAAAQTFYGAGITLLPQSSPKPSAWFVAATNISKTQDVWSFSETDAVLVNKRIVTSARTGIATGLRSFGPWKLFALANAGVATNGGATSGAYAGGGVLTGPFPHSSRLKTILGTRIIRSGVGGTTVTYNIGFGW
ncbi:MAG TPA: hypothetical protein VKX49_12495 [Bryobacteraceae bacterium]|nr:hypothetical protein [Bryobacteraceae bacterium]